MASEFPAELVAQLRRRSPPLKETLRTMKGEFDIDAVLIAHWRRTRHVSSRRSIQNTLSLLVREGALRKVGCGRYTLEPADGE